MGIPDGEMKAQLDATKSEVAGISAVVADDGDRLVELEGNKKRRIA